MSKIIAGLPSPGVLQKVKPENLFLIPRGIARGDLADALIKAGHALPLLSGKFAFTAIELVVWAESTFERYAAAVVAFEPWRQVVPGVHKKHLENVVQALAAQRVLFSDLTMDAPKIMGIVNVTPDSFSDGGDFSTAQAAIEHGIALAAAGADILDIGGESTRPGADPISPEEEQARVLPVISALAERGLKVSIDTRHASTMAVALDAGAAIVNDVTALTGDADSLAVVAKYNTPVVLMHMQGEPQTMQSEPNYLWAPVDVYRELKSRIEVCESAGIQRDKICIDPGIGFGKTDVHNLELLESLSLFHGLGCPVLLGASRKSFIGRLSGEGDAKKRVPGSIGAALLAVSQRAQILRVHDVAETRQALTVYEAEAT